PIPRASAATAAMVNPGLFQNMRIEWRASRKNSLIGVIYGQSDAAVPFVAVAFDDGDRVGWQLVPGKLRVSQCRWTLMSRTKVLLHRCLTAVAQDSVPCFT